MKASDRRAGPGLPDSQTADWRLRQVVGDTYQLSKVGGFLYLFGWAVIAWLGGVMAFAPRVALAIFAGFLVLAWLRLWMRPPAEGNAAAYRRWLLHFAVVLPLASALWAGVQAWILLEGRFDGETRMVSLIATIGYATVFANVYSTVRHLAAVGVCVLFVPTLVVLWSQPEDRALALAVSFYGLYLAGALVRSHAEYSRRLRLDLELREQRDLYENLSRTDALTGVFNRRHFTARLDQLAERAQQGGPSFCLLMLDVDHFKQVNDRHGHVAGDACLKALADRMQRAFDPQRALLARLGGEEFGVLFEGTGAEALAAGEALRHDLVLRPLDCDGQRITVTVSIGLGEFDAPVHGDGEGLYRAVDMALYEAKGQGRNRVLALRPANA
ncbi:MAG: GGDEF domain-containing protein [Arenimonas sp.]|uniref:GGDEF domain-containing protein n=1 Tax=Arenimonas sp. TaxID=1872635 RepID=UPI0025BDCA98|nr:GGDEF domain-containing protein [Arenimonas sp.]MBW8366587.1 GGDEF domain-containing protein [Arenimonas sp.]